MGLSSGGPYTVACAALLGDRVTGAVVAAGNTDMSWPDAADGYLESELRIMAMDDEDAAVADCVERFGPSGERFFEGDVGSRSRRRCVPRRRREGDRAVHGDGRGVPAGRHRLRPRHHRAGPCVDVRPRSDHGTGDRRARRTRPARPDHPQLPHRRSDPGQRDARAFPTVVTSVSSRSSPPSPRRSPPIRRRCHCTGTKATLLRSAA